MDIKQMLTDFMSVVSSGDIELYNEFSLQHELGIYLRSKAEGYRIQFERNASYFNISDTIKHEIDIVIYNQSEYHAVELKYPRNKQYPEQMFAFLKDIRFMEELKNAGFMSTYCMTLVEDKNFYSGRKQDGIYAYFRGNKPIHGLVQKPTGERNETVDIMGTYTVAWKNCGAVEYYIIEAE